MNESQCTFTLVNKINCYENVFFKQWTKVDKILDWIVSSHADRQHGDNIITQN